MDVASVPFTVVTYSEPQCESAREISVSEGPASFPYLQANPAHQPVGRELNKQADAADVPSPFFEGDGSDSEADTASEGRGDAGDAQLALDLQQAEMRRSGLLPDGTTLPSCWPPEDLLWTVHPTAAIPPCYVQQQD